MIAVHLEVHLGALRQAIPHLNQLHEVLPDSEVGRLAGLRQGGLPFGLRTQQRTAHRAKLQPDQHLVAGR